MKVVGLISGGKDSCYNLMQCVAEGHELIALANLRPKYKDELDSYMFQTVGHHAIDLYADALNLPLFRRTLVGTSLERGTDYDVINPRDEVEDMFELLKEVKDALGVEAVSVGAVLSDYQRVRVEHVCSRLGLTALCYMWRRDQQELLQEMIDCGVHAIIIKVAALGLDPGKHLGKTIGEIYPHMVKMHGAYGLNICGEGGEYETFTLDCPLFSKKIVLDEAETVIHSDDAFAPVGYLNLHKMHLEDKPKYSGNWRSTLQDLPMKRSSSLLSEISTEGLVAEEQECPVLQHPCPKCAASSLQDEQIFVRQMADGHCWLSGITALLADDTSVEQSTKNAMDQMLEELRKLGLRSKDLIVMHLYVQNMNQFQRINSIYKTYFGLNPPVRICVEAAMPVNVALQMDCMGYKCDTECSIERRTMHVQGLSHWAPANIGPYSQAVRLGSVVYITGQIALCPATMKIIEGGIQAQCRLSLRHVQRILQAMSTSASFQNIRGAICYVTHPSHVDTAAKEWKRAVSSMQDELGEVNQQSSPLVEYVVVPSLPRGALVEWETWALYESGESIGQRIERHTEHCNITADYLKNGSKEDTQFTVRIRVCKISDAPVELPAILTCLSDMILDILDRIEVPSAKLGYLRVFYSVNSVNADNLPSAYKEIFGHIIPSEGNNNNIPSAAFVPVLGFSSPSQILSIYC